MRSTRDYALFISREDMALSRGEFTGSPIQQARADGEMECLLCSRHSNSSSRTWCYACHQVTLEVSAAPTAWTQEITERHALDTLKSVTQRFLPSYAREVR
jgi:hypothetical protein